MTLLESISIADRTEYGLLMNGIPVPGTGSELELISRVDGTPCGVLASASAADVTRAYDLAEAAQPRWRTTSPAERAAILRRAAVLFRERADEIGALISAGMGKPQAEAAAEVEKGAAILDYFGSGVYRHTGAAYASDADEEVFTLSEPLGIVALITPWNFPFTLPIRKIGAALATGNTALFKPASNSALCALAIGQTFVDAGLPTDVLSVIVGESRVIQHALFEDARLGGVSLTGSYETALAIRKLLPAEIPFQAELGGKNVLVIWKDADLPTALDIIWQSSFRNNGQICTSCGRLLVHQDIADELLALLRAKVADQQRSDSAGEHGILSSAHEHAKIIDVLDRSAGSVAERITSDWGDDRLAPTVLLDPAAGELTTDEIFGPVITFETFESLDEALAKGNATEYGLTAGIVTDDIGVAGTFWRNIKAGLVKVNSPLTGTPYHIPLQGWRHSGIGRGEGGDASFDFFTKQKAIYLRRKASHQHS
jgi:acyl-CoA reductase-like NAD-dependent aldehyde dehydrogenase